MGQHHLVPIAPANRRLAMTEAVLTPATAAAFAVAAHHWGHQPWLGTIIVGIVVALATGGMRWWMYRR